MVVLFCLRFLLFDFIGDPGLSRVAAMNNKPVIITSALTGGAKFNPEQTHVPVTPEEIADSAIASARAGAAVSHIHVREHDVPSCRDV